MRTKQITGEIPMQMARSDYEVYHYKTPFAPVELHFHDFYEIYVLLSDTVVFVIDGRQYRLKQHDILLISPRELHRPVSCDGRGEYERIDIYIRPECIAAKSLDGVNLLTCFNRCQSLGSGNLLRPGLALVRKILHTAHSIQEQKEEGRFGRALLEDALMTQLLVYLNQASVDTDDHGTQDICSNATVDRIIHYINENLSSPIALDDLSDLFFLSKYHLVRMFKRHTGLTPHQFIRYKRLMTARLMLRDGRSVTDVCHACGFSDYTNFIRAFREEFGMSPRRYATSEIETISQIPRTLQPS